MSGPDFERFDGETDWLTWVPDEVVAQKILALCEIGLTKGLGEPKPGHMCVEASVRYALGVGHGDQPPCVHSQDTAIKIELNDTVAWDGVEDRGQALKLIAVAQLGTIGLGRREFSLAFRALLVERVLLPALGGLVNAIVKEVTPSEDPADDTYARSMRAVDVARKFLAAMDGKQGEVDQGAHGVLANEAFDYYGDLPDVVCAAMNILWTLRRQFVTFAFSDGCIEIFRASLLGRTAEEGRAVIDCMLVAYARTGSPGFDVLLKMGLVDRDGNALAQSAPTQPETTHDDDESLQ